MPSYLVLLLVLGSAACNPVFDDAEYSPMLNPDLFEGDILGIDPDADRNAIVSMSSRWPNGTIPYFISGQLEKEEPLIKKAMKHIEDRTCIKFRESTDDDQSYIFIFKGKGCYSYIGCLNKPQVVSIGEGCDMHSIIVHELMHAVGFYHEHSRSDRDDYINIFWENIFPGGAPQFKKLAPNQNNLYDTFDFDSIMLYSDDAFSKGRGLKTMSSKIPGRRIPDVYSKPGLSRSDIYRVKQLYNCK